MKIAISGKGGVGKTTLSACLARHYADLGLKVIAVDADPDANLAAGLGLDWEEALKIKPLSDMKEMVEERTGAKKGTYGGFFKLNPKVDDIPQRFGKDLDGIRLLVAGTIKAGGSGCYCPENVLLKRLFKHLVVDMDEVVILDMEAGIEHLGRATAQAVDRFIVVVEPGMRSIETAFKIKELADDLGIKSVDAIGNKIRTEADRNFLEEKLDGIPLLGAIPYDEDVIHADQSRVSVWQEGKALVTEVKKIVGIITGDE